MRIVSNRLLARALLQCLLAFVFFWSGALYSHYKRCSPLANMSPEHVQHHPELAQAWETGLKHKETFLLILVLSSPKNEERRNVIRQTWANAHKSLRSQFLIYFVVGNFELADDTLDAISNEKAQHKDILALPMVDSYQSLTTKVLTSFVHLSRNVKFKYLLKVNCKIESFLLSF